MNGYVSMSDYLIMQETLKNRIRNLEMQLETKEQQIEMLNKQVKNKGVKQWKSNYSTEGHTKQ